VSTEAVWAIVADPRRLPEWLATVAASHLTTRGEGQNASVEPEGESHGHRYSLTSLWGEDQDVHELEWGNSSSGGYRGSLRGQDAATGSSEIHVNLSVPDERVASWPEAEGEIHSQSRSKATGGFTSALAVRSHRGSSAHMGSKRFHGPPSDVIASRRPATSPTRTPTPT